LEEVFVSWLLQRLPDRSKKEIEKMLIGELPELVDTRAGQDILKIGEERGLKIGEERGLVEATVILLEAKRGRLTKSLRQRLQTLGAKQLRQLLADAIPWESLDLLDAWLAAHGK
jgi:predicted transposase YdaD